MGLIIFYKKEILTDKSLNYTLSNIYGIGIHYSKKIAALAGVYKRSNLILEQINLFNRKLSLIESNKFCYNYIFNYNVFVDLKLKQTVRKHIIKKVKKRSYQGFRHYKSLPVNGQRTHTNANTQRSLSSSRLNHIRV